MMKKMMALGAAMVTVLAMSGCSSLQTATPNDFNGQKTVPVGTSVGHVSATNCGLYLLWIPLITGSSENIGSPAFLQDMVNTRSLAGMVTKKSKEMQASKVLDLTTQNASGGFIFYWPTSYASGNAVK